MSALDDQVDPTASDDSVIPRFTWWDRRGGREWVQYDFDRPTTVSGSQVYWCDERRINAHCRVPQSWRLFYRAEGKWKQVSGAGTYGVEMDRFNRVAFDRVETTALRLQAELQRDWSGGILEWKVEDFQDENR
ncbi:MAG TPA: hypothetical protein VN673_15420 [Clostridia bacterium]|nr:hypothetical protein [Clostridia bacterium]